MSIADGEIEYELGKIPVTGVGFSYNENELNSALEESVTKVLFDDSGVSDIKKLIAGLAETDFEKKNVEIILSSSSSPENWQVGEAIAESYLIEKKNCFFPWPTSRDERKKGSSLPGADLVGFKKDGKKEYFAFGEIKTSSQEKYPPNVCYGEHGFKKQIEDLKDSTDIKDKLVFYLAHRATKSKWKSRYEEAVKNYMNNKNNIRVFGLLVRDVNPDKDDLRVRVEKLSKNVDPKMVIELFAMYLPDGSISKLVPKVVNLRDGGDA